MMSVCKLISHVDDFCQWLGTREHAKLLGVTRMGWFCGFKLHLIVNDQGELLAVQLTPGNSDDRKPVRQMTKKLWGGWSSTAAISPKRSLSNFSDGDCN